MELSDKIVAEAVTWLGTPFRHAGRVKGPDGGVDCGMLIAEVYARAGAIPHVDVPHYSVDWHHHANNDLYTSIVARYMYPLDDGQQPAPADVMLMRIGNNAAHGAIVIKWPLVIHAWMMSGVVYAEGDCRLMQKRLINYWRLK